MLLYSRRTFRRIANVYRNQRQSEIVLWNDGNTDPNRDRNSDSDRNTASHTYSYGDSDSNRDADCASGNNAMPRPDDWFL